LAGAVAAEAQGAHGVAAQSPALLATDADDGEDVDVSIDAPPPLEPAGAADKTAAAEGGRHSMDAPVAKVVVEPDAREAKFEQWVEESKKEEEQEESKATLDNQAFLAIRGSLVRRKQKVDTLEDKLAHAVKKGQDSDELLHKTIDADKAHEKQIEAEHARQMRQEEESAEAVKRGLEQQLANSSQQVEAEKKVLEQLGQELVQSRKQLEIALQSEQDTETTFNKKLEEENNEIASKEQTIQYLQGAKANEEAEVNATKAKNRQIFTVARRTIQKVKGLEKAAKAELEKEKTDEKAREDVLRKQIEAKDRELAEDNRKQAQLQQQLTELEALATRTGDTAAKMLGVKANRSKPAAPHVAVAVKEKAEADTVDESQLATELDQGGGDDQTADSAGDQAAKSKGKATSKANAVEKRAQPKAHKKSAGTKFLEVSSSTTSEGDDDSVDPDPEDLVAISME